MSDRPAVSIIEYSSPAPSFFLYFELPHREPVLAACSFAMFFGARAAVVGIVIADALAYAPQPVTRPRELDAQDCQAKRNEQQSRPRCNEHDDADQQYRCANDGNDDPSRRLVSEMCDPFDHGLSSLVNENVLLTFLRLVGLCKVRGQEIDSPLPGVFCNIGLVIAACRISKGMASVFINLHGKRLAQALHSCLEVAY